MAMVALWAAVLLAPYGHDHYLSRDGGWCWFADPRALWVGDRLLVGGVTSKGDVVANAYSLTNDESQLTVLAQGLEKDDHANPAFLRLPGGTVAAFYSKHTGTDLWMRQTLRPGNYSGWSPAVRISPNDPAYKGPVGALNTYTYPNPRLLTGEHDRIYLFWRGMNWKPTLSWSDDLGKTWTKGRIVVSPESEDPNNRPYTKLFSDGKSRIDLAFTDGHPRNEPTNSIYFARYEKGSFRRADGSLIAPLSRLPFKPSDADVVYDGRAESVRAWIWDVQEDGQGRPVIVYVRLPQDDRHVYRYVHWDGHRWIDREIVEGGKWFPMTPAGKSEPEPHYSGGLCLDPNDTRFVYLSRSIHGRFEIERWFTPDGGDSWSHVAVTGESKHDNVRPFVPPGRTSDRGPVAVWLNMNRYVHYTDYFGTQQAANEDRGPWSESDPLRAARAVWAWARSNPSEHGSLEWTEAPLYSGLLDLSSATGDPGPVEWVRHVAEVNSWKLGKRPFMADDQAVGQAYLQLYGSTHDDHMIQSVRTWAESVLSRPHSESLEWKGAVSDREWAWCDSLYMAPPVLAMLAKETGDHRFLDLLSELWWKTSDYLYDRQEHLFYRDSRYFQPREANGQKVFWSRGNGWVLAGLARVLQAMPATDPQRVRFLSQFQGMSAKIASLQTPDGTWHASLLDPRALYHFEVTAWIISSTVQTWSASPEAIAGVVLNPAPLLSVSCDRQKL